MTDNVGSLEWTKTERLFNQVEKAKLLELCRRWGASFSFGFDFALGFNGKIVAWIIKRGRGSGWAGMSASKAPQVPNYIRFVCPTWYLGRKAFTYSVSKVPCHEDPLPKDVLVPAPLG